ncbi:TetR/AcrR family transcriptional regulator [Nocardia huaxiensis]|uniref:TetR/AcrR family transcriptional regulator n=1 Tax=Nocardia huaxiensis TaxID=2755382 RepID=A0A7D6Z699_9NOCA|nr:TetR/AcrR family transcriptional regulator [Nocardia huaxiensis]QLY32644.1 TetR/AcrR family transcriptional regulator [Nocardia huaxiensis]UFS93623.1 TetR family transcriptional regulator [Nocardia huaxiensis]
MSSHVPATFTTVHPLSDSQRERRQRLLTAARDLAATGGYAAVTMHAVADSAQLARATVYRYFGSKDQLLTAVGAEWAREVTAAWESHDVPGRPAERVATLLTEIIDRTAAELPLCSAVVSAIISGDPTAEGERRGLYGLWMGRFDEILEEAVAAEDRAEIDYLLGQLLLAAFTSMCMLGQSPEQVRNMMVGAAHRLLP